MTLKDFYKFYDLKEIDVEEMYNVGNDLYIILNMNVYIELIANGYRPEMDMVLRHLFVFKNAKVEINVLNPKISKYEFNDGIVISFDKEEIVIKSEEIYIIENYEKN